jgi:hypothetical protein
MSDNTPNPLNASELDLERQLRRLSPARHGIDRDALMFQAGRHSTSRPLRQWRAVSLAFALTTATLAVTHLDLRSGDPALTTAESTGGEKLAAVEPAAPRAAQASKIWTEDRWPAPGGPEMFRLRERLLTDGLDGLPASGYAAPSTDLPASPMDWLRQSRSGAGLSPTRSMTHPSSPGNPS